MVRPLQEVHRTLILPDIGLAHRATLSLESFAAEPHLSAHAAGCPAVTQSRIPGPAAGGATPPGSRYGFGV
jgi:hypothetical protein